MTKLKYERNNELVLKYQNGDDEAFTELYTINEGLIRSIINKYQHVKIVDRDSMLSACNFGFANASKTYTPKGGVEFSSYCIMSMEREIINELNFLKHNGRAEMIKNSESVNRMIQGKEGEVEAIYFVDAKEEEVYFEGEFLITQEAIQYAMSKSKAPFKQNIVSILCDDYSQSEVAKAWGLSRQTVAYQVKRFKEYMKEFFDDVGLNKFEEVI